MGKCRQCTVVALTERALQVIYIASLLLLLLLITPLTSCNYLLDSLALSAFLSLSPSLSLPVCLTLSQVNETLIGLSGWCRVEPQMIMHK